MSAPSLQKTRDCGDHRPYRSRLDAEAQIPFHPAFACDRCRRGMFLHAFLCDAAPHWHVGHWWPR